MRKVFFWLHLIAGSTAGIVVLIMSVTGVLLMYERQTIAWFDRGFQSSPAGAKLPPEALLASVASQKNSMPGSLTLYSNPEAPAELTFGPQVVYADAYSGRVLGEGSAGIRRFFRAVTDWHRYLSLEGPRRRFGKAITGAANLLFLGLALSGMYLWLPRRFLWPNVQAIVFFRRGLSGKARDFNWHNVIGIWSAVPLVFVILGAAVISYPWATNLVYRITGDEPPRPAPQAAPAANPGPPSAGLNNAWARAEAAVPGWGTIAWRPSGGDGISLAIAGSHRGRVDLKSTLIVSRASGEILRHETYESFNTGRRVRSWLRYIHTGEALGVAGQTIAGLVSAGGAVLVWTGLALAWRRFRNWRARKSVEVREPAAVLTRGGN
jgi:uncharacterized iron-regulated membrane protein